MKQSRHNGRSGKNGVYNPKHNDRRFNVTNSEHISDERIKKNIYWDCYQGYRTGEESTEFIHSFESVEKVYYYEHYEDYCKAQNKRNINNRHPERNRLTEDIRLSNKTCPEETILQIGKMGESIDPDTLVKIAEEYFDTLNKKYGDYFHVIDWALHVDESTPHIHERHVFDCPNKYGEVAPQQEKALEVMGIELPDKNKKTGRYNNRKITFDKECRELLAEIAAKHQIEIDLNPTYGGRGYLEKQDFIIQKQKEELDSIIDKIDNKQSELTSITMKIEDIDSFVKEVSAKAYEQAAEVVSKQVNETVKEVALDNISSVENILDNSKYSKENVTFAKRVINTIVKKIKGAISTITNKVSEKLYEPEIMNEAKRKIEETARVSIHERLNKAKKESMNQRIDDNKIHNRSSKEIDIE